MMQSNVSESSHVRSQFDELLKCRFSSEDEASGAGAGGPAGGKPPSEQPWHGDACRGLASCPLYMSWRQVLEVGRLRRASVSLRSTRPALPCQTAGQSDRPHEPQAGPARGTGGDQKGNSIAVLTEASPRLQAQRQGGCRAAPGRTVSPPALQNWR